MSKQRTAPRDLLARERMTRALDMCLRLDELLVSYWQRAKKDVAVAYLVLKIVDQRARLLGLNIESEEVEKPMIVIREVPGGYLGEDDKPLSNGAVSPSLISHTREYDAPLGNV